MSVHASPPRARPRRPPEQYLEPEPSVLWQTIINIGKVTGGTLLATVTIGSALAAGSLVGLAVSFRNLPDVRILLNYTPSETSYIYDIKGRVLASIHDEANREVVPLNKISPHLKRAVMAIEDSNFYQHPGINFSSLLRAVAVNFERGRTTEGGSTLTMQLVKNLFLSPQRKLSRKIAEAVLSLRLEQILSKDQILDLYLNQVYWGHNNYGAETAARSYFNKPASQLTLAEAAMMAGLISAPEDYSPFINYQRAKQRQLAVLQRMRDIGWIKPEEAIAAQNQPIALGEVKSFQSSRLPYITEAASAELKRRFGRESLLEGGMRVQTTVDFDFQKMAEASVREAHERMRASGLRADQVALVAVDPRTHFVKAMVGGVDYQKSQFNRAIQAMRQPGSAFKPFVYYTALATGRYTIDSAVKDTPFTYRDGGATYRPKNYGGGFSGSVSMRHALEKSLNLPVLHLGQEVGLNRVIEVCRNLGFQSPLEPITSLPLGSEDVTPLEMAGAYATFASGGWYSETTFIAQVTDSRGKVLLDNTPNPRQVLNPWAVAQLNEALKGVISQGTAKAADIGRPAAGKTGTTDSERDIWFVGYVPQLAAAVWVGNDNYRPIGYGATGGTYVAPIWRSFMMAALKDMPPEDFKKSSEFQKP